MRKKKAASPASPSAPAARPKNLDRDSTELTRQAFTFRKAVLSDETVDAMVDRLATDALRVPTLAKVALKSLGRSAQPGDGDLRELFRALFVVGGRELVENPPQLEKLAEGFDSIFTRLAAKFPFLDKKEAIAFITTAISSASRYALGVMASTTAGVEGTISKLAAEAAEREASDPDEAAIIRARIALLLKKLPRGYVPTPAKSGRPKLNVWNERRLDELFQAGVPTRRIAKLVSKDQAYIRRRIKPRKARLAAMRRAVDKKSEGEP